MTPRVALLNEQLRLFNAHYDEYGFQPIVVFDGAIRCNWPKTEILLRGDSHYCTSETIDFCRANGLDFVFGVAPTSALRADILALEAKATAMFEAAPKNGKV